MSIAHIPLQTADFCAQRDTPVARVIDFMMAHSVNHVPVCDGDKFLGLVGINGILEAILPAGVKAQDTAPDLAGFGDCTVLLSRHLAALNLRSAEELINTTLPCLSEDSAILESLLLLTQHSTPLPVLDSHGMLKGFLSRRALLKYLVTGSH